MCNCPRVSGTIRGVHKSGGCLAQCEVECRPVLVTHDRQLKPRAACPGETRASPSTPRVGHNGRPRLERSLRGWASTTLIPYDQDSLRVSEKLRSSIYH